MSFLRPLPQRGRGMGGWGQRIEMDEHKNMYNDTTPSKHSESQYDSASEQQTYDFSDTTSQQIQTVETPSDIANKYTLPIIKKSRKAWPERQL